MGTGNIDRAATLFRGIANHDPQLATTYVNKTHYTEHDPRRADGEEALREYIRQLPHDAYIEVIRAFEDGSYVFTQSHGQIAGQNTFFDIFRFDGGLMVEHSGFSAPAGPPNKSGHTQVDGPRQATHLSDTEKNKSLMREYYQTFHIFGDHAGGERYFHADLCIRHEPGVRDGVAEFKRDVGILMQHRTIDEIKLLLGQGDFVFIAAKGTHHGDACVYIDLYRVEYEKLIEHWGFPEMVPPRTEWKNQNGML